MDTFNIELVVDELYGPAPRISWSDLEFVAQIKLEHQKLLKRIWVHGQLIDELNIDELLVILINLIDNKTMFFRDQWRELIKQEIKIKLTQSNYEVSKEIISAGGLF